MTKAQRAYYAQPFKISANALKREAEHQPVVLSPKVPVFTCTLCKQTVPSEDDLYEITDQGKVWNGYAKLCLSCGRRALARVQQKKEIEVGQTVFRQGKPGVVVAVSGDVISVRWPEGLFHKTYPVSRQELY